MSTPDTDPSLQVERGDIEDDNASKITQTKKNEK